MYHPALRIQSNGIPFLQKAELDLIGDRFVKDFQPNVLEKPGPVDVERFIEYYLGMTQDYQYLSHNGMFLGMTVFKDSDKIPVFCPELNRAEYISAKAHTCIIDNRLLEANQHHRYRFTLGHEAGHDILHTRYYTSCDETQGVVSVAGSAVVQCRMDSGGYRNKKPKEWNDKDTMEWQANRFASAILMPMSAIKKAVSIQPRYITGIDLRLVKYIAELFDVSQESAAYRMKELGYTKSDLYYGVSLDDYAI